LTAAGAHAGADKKSLSFISLAQKMLLGEKELVDVIRVVPQCDHHWPSAAKAVQQEKKVK
jgi:hypothetical protein